MRPLAHEARVLHCRADWKRRMAATYVKASLLDWLSQGHA